MVGVSAYPVSSISNSSKNSSVTSLLTSVREMVKRFFTYPSFTVTFTRVSRYSAALTIRSYIPFSRCGIKKAPCSSVTVSATVTVPWTSVMAAFWMGARSVRLTTEPFTPPVGSWACTPKATSNAASANVTFLNILITYYLQQYR